MSRKLKKADNRRARTLHALNAEISKRLKCKSTLFEIVLIEFILFCGLSLILLHKELGVNIPFVTSPEVTVDQTEIVKKPVKIVQDVHAQSSAGFDLAKFQSYGFPAPEDPNPAAMSESALQGWNQYLRDHVADASNATGVDPGIIGMWPYVETQGSWVPFDNCNQELNGGLGGDSNPNTQCPLWGDYWQVGPGNHLAHTHMFLADAFEAMYGSQDNETVQSVGQSVIDSHTERFGSPLTIVTTFPNRSLSSIVDDAVSGDMTSRTLMATLMKDDAIGVYLIARHFRDNKGLDSGLADEMEGWSSSYYDKQKIINHIKAIYDAGVSGGGGGTGGVGSGSQTFTLVLRPLEPDSWVINRVTANAIGGGSGTSGSGQGAPPGSVDGHCTPTGGYPTNPEFELSSKYNVTTSGYGPEGVKMIYELMTCLSGSRFVSLFADTSVTVHNGLTIIGGNETIGMGCSSNSNCDIYIPEGTNAFKFILTHEFGHVIHIVNSHETIHFSELENAYAKEGGLSPYSGGGNGCGVGGVYEDFAEMVAYYYNPTMGGKTGGCDNRVDPPNSLFGTSDFPLHLEVAKKVL